MLRAGYDVQWTAVEGGPSAGPPRPEWDAELFRGAGRYLREHPGAIPELLWVKFRVHWSLDVAPRRNPAERPDALAPALRPDDPVTRYSEPLFERLGRTVHVLSWGPLLLLGLLGTALTARGWRDVSLLWFVQLAMTLVYVAIHPSTRYRAPGDPLLFLLSASALVWLGECANRWRMAHGR
jgi:hypothetical protein